MLQEELRIYRMFGGRAFEVVASFEDSDEGTTLANDYMTNNPGTSVIEVTGGRVFIAHSGDKGIDMPGTVRPLICSCCGAETKGKQWHNRDYRYGLCPDCISICCRGESAASFRSKYGYRGIHFDVQV